MTGLGAIIRELREEKNMTRGELTEGICTEKYLYLIEKGERNPSADILLQFGRRLKTDLYQFYRYSDCQEPLKVARIVEELNKARGLTDYDERLRLAKEAEKLADFKNKPWFYIKESAKFEYYLVIENKVKETLAAIEELIESMTEEEAISEFATVLYLAYAYALERDEQYEKSYEIVAKIEDIQEKKKEYYNPVALNVVIETGIISIVSSFRLQKYQETYDKAQGLRQLMKDFALYARGSWLFAFLAFSCFCLGKKEEALLNFKRALTMQMLSKNRVELTYLTADESYKKLMEEFAEDYVVKEFVRYCQLS